MGREAHQLTNSLEEIAPIAPRESKGDAPRQTSSLWNIGPTGRCFKTNPQHARPLSGANSLAASEVRFDGGPPPADLRPSQGKAEPDVVEGKVDRAGPGIYVCKTNPPRRRHRMWSRGEGWEEDVPIRFPHSLSYAVTAKAVRN